MSLASKLKDLRLKSGKSLQQVADAVGTSKAHVWDLEQGNSANPTKDLLSKFGTCFRVSVSELLEEDPNAVSEPSELVALYRDLKSLSDNDRRTIEAVMRGLKDSKKNP
jgi:transcriptional regulator with XRE-family HTH domain